MRCAAESAAVQSAAEPSRNAVALPSRHNHDYIKKGRHPLHSVEASALSGNQCTQAASGLSSATVALPPPPRAGGLGEPPEPPEEAEAVEHATRRWATGLLLLLPGVALSVLGARSATPLASSPTSPAPLAAPPTVFMRAAPYMLRFCCFPDLTSAAPLRVSKRTCTRSAPRTRRPPKGDRNRTTR